MLYLATLRAGHVFLPLNTAYQSAEIAYFIENAEPSVVVCSPKNFGWVSKIAFKAGTQNVFTLGDDRIAVLDMTLTSAACPLTDVIEKELENALDNVVERFRINWVWMPPWGPDKITDDGREMLRALGFNL